jgi:hypothetical protein
MINCHSDVKRRSDHDRLASSTEKPGGHVDRLSSQRKLSVRTEMAKDANSSCQHGTGRFSTTEVPAKGNG